MNYIKVKKVYDKLKRAEELYLPVIMTAANGWGKSAAVRYFYRRKKICVLNCRLDGRLEPMPPVSGIRAYVVVVENLQWLSDPEGIDYLKGLLAAAGRQIVMLTRGCVPQYLAAEDMDLGFIRIQEADLALAEDEVRAFMEEEGITLHPEDIKPLTAASEGYIRALHFYAARMANGVRYSEEMQEAVWEDIFHLWEESVFRYWPETFQKFVMAVCTYETFSVEFAEYMTGNPQVRQLIDYCREKMSQLEFRTDGFYAMRREIRRFFLWRREMFWSREEKEENYRRVAAYYEENGDIPKALKYYKEAGDTAALKKILIKNACLHPGAGRFVEAREYYFALPREEVLDSPVLMAAMSMLYDLLLQPEASEEWLAALKKYAKDKGRSAGEKKEARVRIAYLEIALPHKGVKGILRTMRNVFTLVQKENIVLPEFSATGNMPSLMNGGLDFCEWSKNDVQIAKMMGAPISVLLGKYGNGLVTLALAESGFEKGTMPEREVLSRCMNGYQEAANGGRIEMCFVAAGIQVRQNLILGKMSAARRALTVFQEKAQQEKALQVAGNLEALSVLLLLRGGIAEECRISSYIDKTEDARVFFSILDRYRQMVKIRCLIASDRLEEALELSEFLMGYFKNYERHFLRMENALLQSVILYRMGEAQWKDRLQSALKETAEYHFIRLVSIEGAAVLPLLNRVKGEAWIEKLGAGYFEELIRECESVALFYPDYLHFVPQIKVVLTRREQQVLSLLCAGKTMEEICDEMDISYAGLKKHNRSIYKKLDAGNRAEAERKALQLGLVHRG